MSTSRRSPGSIGLTLRALLLLAAGVFLLGAECVVPAAAAQKITFTTDFGFNGRHSYYFVAQEKGYYREAGLEVEWIRGTGSADAIRTVAAGRAQLGFADTGTLVISRTNQPLPVKAVAIVYNRPPHAIYCLEESGIRTLKDLEGKTVADTAGSAVPLLFPAVARPAGVDKEKVKWVVADSASLPAMLVSRQVDCVGQFTVGEPLLARRAAPKKLVRLTYAEAGLDLYGSAVIASEAVLKDQPDLVRRFVAATVRGMEAAFADPAEAGRITNKVHPQIEAAIGQGETEAVRELAVTPVTRARGLGYIDPKRMELTRDVVAEAFNLPRRIPVEDLYAPGFAGK